MSRIIFIIKKQFPYNKPVFNGFKQLIGSLFTLIKEQPLLCEATLINVFSFAQFGAFGLQWFYYFQKNLSILLVPQ
jgi:hypothetical protein